MLVTKPYFYEKISGPVGIQQTMYLSDKEVKINFSTDKTMALNEFKIYDEVEQWIELKKSEFFCLYLQTQYNDKIYYVADYAVKFDKFISDTTDFLDIKQCIKRRLDYNNIKHAVYFMDKTIESKQLINYWVDSASVNYMRLPSILETPDDPHLLNFLLFIMNYYRKVSLIFLPWNQLFYLEYSSVKSHIPFQKINSFIQEDKYLFSPNLYNVQTCQEAINRLINAYNALFQTYAKYKPNNELIKYFINLKYMI